MLTDNTAVDIPRGLEHLRLEAEGKRKRVELAERWGARDLVVAIGHRTGRF
jgi:hypothetical protein